MIYAVSAGLVEGGLHFYRRQGRSHGSAPLPTVQRLTSTPVNSGFGLCRRPSLVRRSNALAALLEKGTTRRTAGKKP